MGPMFIAIKGDDLVMQRVAIIGGGISGLAAAYFALGKGYAVDLFEKDDQWGGLAASFDFGGLSIEKYYHFICGGDRRLIALAGEIGLGSALRFRPTQTANFHNGRLYPFTSPLDLLRFRPIPLLSRIRFGFNIALSKYTKNWTELDGISAKEWLSRNVGTEAYEAVWQPHLKMKFGPYAEQISAAWIWHRIHRASSSRKGLFSPEKMGYFVGGSRTFLDKLVADISARGGRIHLRAELREIRKNGGTFKLVFPSSNEEGYAKVVLALPLPISAALLSALHPDYSRELRMIPFLAIVCGVFRLKKKVSDAFWLNISDPRIASSGFIEYSNLNPLSEAAPETVLYIPSYVGTEDRLCQLDQDSLKAELFPVLRAVKPDLETADVVDFRAFKHPYAQAVCSVGFKDKIPEYVTPLEDLYILDSTQLYPADRNLSALIVNAEKLIAGHF